MTVTIALDAMGGDRGPSVCVPAGLAMVRAHDDLKIILVGQHQDVAPRLERVREIRRARMEDRVILNSESPSILARAAGSRRRPPWPSSRRSGR